MLFYASFICRHRKRHLFSRDDYYQYKLYMRSLFSAFTAGLVTTVVAACTASTPTSGATVTKDYDYKNFKSISVSNFFDVTVIKSAGYDVRVTVSEEYEEYLDVKIKDGTLSIGFKNLPTRLNAAQIGKIAKAEVKLPSLEGVSVAGAGKLTSKDHFELGRGVFNMSVSGASQVKKLDVNASEARLYLSGASKSSLTGKFVDLYVTASGTARAELAASADELEAKASGTAVIELEGSYDEVGLNSSGVGNITMSGDAGSVELRGAGTSGFNLADLEARTVEVELGGASVAKVNALRELSVELSGSTRCSYVDNNGLKIRNNGVSTASRLRAL